MLTIKNLESLVKFQIETDDNWFRFNNALEGPNDVYEFYMADASDTITAVYLKRYPEPNGLYLLSYNQHNQNFHVDVRNIRDVKAFVSRVGRCITNYGRCSVILPTT